MTDNNSPHHAILIFLGSFYLKELSEELGEGLKSRYSDLGDAPFWAILIGYDGGRKMQFITDVK